MIDDGRLDEAISELQLAIDRQPDFARAYFLLGGLQRGRGDLVPARQSLNNALASGLEEELIPVAKLYLGLTDYQLGDERSAFKTMSDLIENGAELGQAYLIRGVILANRGQYMSARADLDRAIFFGLAPEERQLAQEILQELPAAATER